MSALWVIYTVTDGRCLHVYVLQINLRIEIVGGRLCCGSQWKLFATLRHGEGAPGFLSWLPSVCFRCPQLDIEPEVGCELRMQRCGIFLSDGLLFILPLWSDGTQSYHTVHLCIYYVLREGWPFRILTPVYECLSWPVNPPPSHSSSRCCFHGAGIARCLASWQADFVRSSSSAVFSQSILCQGDLRLASLGLPSYHDQAVGLFKSMLSSHKEINTFGSVGSLLSTASLAGNAQLCLENSFSSLFPLSPLLIFKPFISVSISSLAMSLVVSSLVSEIRIHLCCIFNFFWGTLLNYAIILCWNHAELTVSGRERSSLDSFSFSFGLLFCMIYDSFSISS